MTIKNFIIKHILIKLKIKYVMEKEVHYFVEKYCKGYGIEIGGAAHNSFAIQAKNVDICSHDNPNDVYHKEQLRLCNKVKKSRYYCTLRQYSY